MEATLTTTTYAHIPFTDGVPWGVTRTPCDSEQVPRCFCDALWHFIAGWVEFLFSIICSCFSSPDLLEDVPTWEKSARPKVDVVKVEETFTLSGCDLQSSMQIVNYAAQMAGHYLTPDDVSRESNAEVASIKVTSILKDGVVVSTARVSKDSSQAVLYNKAYDAGVEMPRYKDVVYSGTSISASMTHEEIRRILVASLEHMGVGGGDEQTLALKILMRLVKEFIYREASTYPFSECGVVRVGSDPVSLYRSVGAPSEPDRVSMNLGNLNKRIALMPAPSSSYGGRDYVYEFFHVVSPHWRTRVEQESKGKFTLVSHVAGSHNYVVELMRKR